MNPQSGPVNCHESFKDSPIDIPIPEDPRLSSVLAGTEQTLAAQLAATEAMMKWRETTDFNRKILGM